MKKGTIKEHPGWVTALVVTFVFIVLLLVFVLGLDRKIIDSIKAVIQIIEVGP